MSDSCWIETFSGRRVHPLAPRAEEICIEDIAHALSNQCRFSGHVRKFWSVAQHSVCVSRLCPPEDAKWGLLHDASEAYLIDLPRPIKHQSGLGEVFREIEWRIERVVAEAFALPFPIPASVKCADSAMLLAEKAALMPGIDWDVRPEDWGIEVVEAARGVEIVPVGPEEAERQFLARFAELFGTPSLTRFRSARIRTNAS